MPKVLKSFRILSLSGGGARGLFQAHLLNNIAGALGEELHELFDLIAGTSVGAINGAMISLGIPPKEGVTLFNQTLVPLFTPRPFRKWIGQALLRGAAYDQSALRSTLANVLKDRTIGDCKTRFLCTAASLSGYKARVFTNALPDLRDNSLPLLDVLLSSAAAPTYFDPVEISNLNQAFVDGGVWANSPTLAAVLFAHKKLNVPFEAMQVLSIGTGTAPTGSTVRRFRRLRPVSRASIAATFDLMFSSQQDFYDETASQLIGRERVLHIDCVLKNDIKLTDAKKALEVLPALASDAYEKNRDALVQMFSNPLGLYNNEYATQVLATAEMLVTAGLSRIIPARKFYNEFREGAANITEYINSAHRSITMVSINLRAGIRNEGIQAVFKSKLSANPEFRIVVSLLNPAESLLAAINRSVNDSEHALFANEINHNLVQLLEFKAKLPPQEADRIDIRTHNSIPFASAIILDEETASARIQLETKAYKEPLGNSFALEICKAPQGVLYESLARGYSQLLLDGTSMTLAPALSQQ